MNRQTYIILLCGIGLFLTASCKKSALLTYDAPDNIYFDFRTGVNPSQGSKGFTVDSLDFTFAYSSPDVKDSIIPIPVLIAGRPADHDRTFNLVVDPASTAIKDKHYVMPPSFLMRAGRVADTVFIRLLRDPELQHTTVTLMMHLENNENFITSLPYKTRATSVSTADTISLLRFRLRMSDQLTSGPSWDIYYFYYFGPFSEKKVRLMNTVVGMPLDFWSVPFIQVDAQHTALQIYYATRMGRYLNDQAASGNTIYDEDGTPMQMDPAYQ